MFFQRIVKSLVCILEIKFLTLWTWFIFSRQKEEERTLIDGWVWNQSIPFLERVHPLPSVLMQKDSVLSVLQLIVWVSVDKGLHLGDNALFLIVYIQIPCLLLLNQECCAGELPSVTVDMPFQSTVACLLRCNQLSPKPHEFCMVFKGWYSDVRNSVRKGRKKGDWMPDKKPVSDYLKKCTHTHIFSRNLPQSYKSVSNETLAQEPISHNW